MKTAIVGANGFIGSRLTEIMHLGGRHTAVPVVRRPSALALPARFALDWRIADALDAGSLAAALEGCDAAVHTALGDPRQIEAMPSVLCAAAAAAGLGRVVYLSSAAVHGQCPPVGTTEDSPLHCRHAMEYNNAKVRAERAFVRGCARHGLAGFILRPGVVFGPRSRWIADVASELRQGRAWLIAGGSGICNSLYVDNLVEAITQALCAGTENAGAYFVGDAECVTWLEFYGAVAAALGIDAAEIHRLDEIPTFPRTMQHRIAQAISGRVAQTAMPVLPRAWKDLGKRLVGALAAAPSAPDGWRLRDAPRPNPTQELTLLQQCRWRFSSDRAALRLGYRPIVSFEVAMRRSLQWLAFAESA
jgi:nucleoside-diphosphate-sugar epimerase